jgi:hypothetical protein
MCPRRLRRVRRFVCPFAVVVVACTGSALSALEIPLALTTPKLEAIAVTVPAASGDFAIDARWRYDARGNLVTDGEARVDGRAAQGRGKVRPVGDDFEFRLDLKPAPGEAAKFSVRLSGLVGGASAACKYRGPRGAFLIESCPARIDAAIGVESLLTLEPEVDCKGKLAGRASLAGGFANAPEGAAALRGKIDARRGTLKFSFKLGAHKLVFAGSLGRGSFDGAAALRLPPERRELALELPIAAFRPRSGCPSFLPNLEPFADAGLDREAFRGAAVELDGRGSSDGDGDRLSFEWRWLERPAASAAELLDAASPRPSFVPDLHGEYRLELVVGDGLSRSAPDEVLVRTVNRAPAADAGPDLTRRIGETAVLDASGSSDADGDLLRYRWSMVSRPARSAAAIEGAESPRATFDVDAPGEYVVELIVDDGIDAGPPDRTVVSTLNSPPRADAGADLTAHVGETATLDGCGSSDVDGDVLSFEWSLVSAPEGSQAALDGADSPRPSFAADRAGSYEFELVVRDGKLASHPDRMRLSTINSPPAADAGADQTAHVGDTIRLDGSRSTDVDGDLLRFHWSLASRPEGSKAEIDRPEAVDPSLTIDRSGTYVAQLIVRDGELDSDPESIVISTVNSPPVADAGADLKVELDAVASLDGSASRDADGDPLSYRWSLIARPDGSSAELDRPEAPDPALVSDRRGTYIAQLIVSDGLSESAPDTVVITTENLRPVAEAGTAPLARVGERTQLDGRGSYDPDDEPIVEFRWSFTSLPPKSAAALDDPASPTPSFLVDAPGTYVVQLIISDGYEDSAPDTVVVSTFNSPPVAIAGPDQEVRVGDLVQLDGTASYDLNGDPLSFDWAFGFRPRDSHALFSEINVPRPTFSPDQPGDYIIRLLVGDRETVSEPDWVKIVVLPRP